MKLPDYSPPPATTAIVAVAASPILVLLTFVAVVWQIVETDTALAIVVACTVWVIAEMHTYQRNLDAYNADYVAIHLSWRSSATLSVLAAQEQTKVETRDFVLAYVHGGRTLRPDTPSLG